MRMLLFGLGVLSLLALVIWIGFFSSRPAFRAEIAGRGFSEPSFSATANNELTRGEKVRDGLVEGAKRWDFLFHLASWASLAATSIVTLITGALGNLDTLGPNKRSLRIVAIGLLSALASVSTLFGSYAKGETQSFRAAAVELTTTLRRSVNDLKAAPSDEQAILLQLKPAIDGAER
ncbi:hypothetical protein [Bradyrhizobium vignae]|uniref:Uncharacterized protein n=1 Tax=Bradyrhizobium vignae TaxID=1549949 RepID=A0ABS4A599_9BRAD|nr:hypothetical protein [Bradyrhizobium vignae]MBP0115585.1 hypothetical protein [Bradyrhizobium vignae]